MYRLRDSIFSCKLLANQKHVAIAMSVDLFESFHVQIVACATFILDPDKRVADMPRNHFICNMVKATAVFDRGIGVPCSHNCSQSYSVARCVTCEKFLCRVCLTIHN
jgi:hypothetical protein